MTAEEVSIVGEPEENEEEMGDSLRGMIDRMEKREERKRDPERIGRAIAHAIAAHSNHSLKESKAFLRRDGFTPYWAHPVECASRLLQERDLPDDVRFDCAEAMVYHDMIEDTSADFLPETSQRVRDLVKAMTFEDGVEEIKMVLSRKLGPEVLLMKLFDKVSGVGNGPWIDEGTPERRQYYVEYTALLADAVEDIYGNLGIVKAARGLGAAGV